MFHNLWSFTNMCTYVYMLLCEYSNLYTTLIRFSNLFIHGHLTVQ